MERPKQQGGLPPAGPRAGWKASEPGDPPARHGWISQTANKIKQKARSLVNDFVDYAKRSDL